MARLNDKQKNEIRRRILESAGKHFISEGYEATSTKQLAREAGIAEGTLFNYFSSKADLMLEVIAAEVAGQTGPERKTDFIENLPEFINDLVVSYIGRLLVFPKRIVQEVLIAGAGIARRKSALFKKLAEADYKVIEDLEFYLVKAANLGIIKKTDCRLLAESVFSQVFTEALIYLYESDYRKDLLMERIKRKIRFTILPYLNQQELTDA